MQLKVLIVTTRAPLPVARGDTLIVWNRIIEYQKKGIKPDILILDGKKKITPLDSAKLSSVLRDVFYLPPTAFTILKALFLIIFKGLPLQVGPFVRSKRISRKTIDLLSLNNYDVIHAFLSRSAETALIIPGKVRVLEYIDSLSRNFSERRISSSKIKSIIYASESKRLLIYENKISTQFAVTSTVSAKDAEFIADPKILVLPNGVDTNIFRSSFTKRNKTTLVISGNIEYLPNLNAVKWFVPIFKKYYGETSMIDLLILGKGSERVEKMFTKTKNVIFCGYTEDLALELSKCHIALCPIFQASGIQNKLVEALACGLPVVASSKVIDAFPHDLSSFVHRADTESEFVASINSILGQVKEPPAIQESVEFVRKNYSWNSSFEVLFKSIILFLKQS